MLKRQQVEYIEEGAQMRKNILSMLLLLTIFGCAKNDDDNAKPVDPRNREFLSTPLTGSIQGTTFSPQTMVARVQSAGGEDVVRIRIYEEVVNNPCSDFSTSNLRKIFVEAPAQEGEYVLDAFAGVQTFIANMIYPLPDGSFMNLIPTFAKIKILHLDENSIAAKLLAYGGGSQEPVSDVNGFFEIEICN